MIVDMHRVVLAIVVSACGAVTNATVDAQPDADPCATATCECTAATEDADCGAHAVCNETGPGRVCACVAAYADQAGSCVFVGAPLDRGFADPTKWMAGIGSTINAAATGNVDPGEGSVNRIGICQFGGFKQTFAMPPRGKADPFKLTVTHAIIDANQSLSGGVEVAVGGQWFEAASSRNVFRSDSTCLGSRAYGGDTEFQAATAGNVTCAGTSTSTFSFDQVAVSVASPNECPLDGTAINGDFDVASAWAFTLASGGTGTFVTTGGQANSAAVQLGHATNCSEVTVTGTIALGPQAMANQAIEVFVNGSSGARLLVSLGGREIGSLFGSGSGKPFRICVPSWAHGTTAELSLFSQSTSSTSCQASTKTFTIDSVKVVDEPTCGDADLTDAGFERTANATGPVPSWGLRSDVVNNVEGGLAQVLNSPGQAHTGNGVLRLSSVNECSSSPTARTAFIVPPPQGANGPAVRFFSNISSSGTPKTTSTVAISLGSSVLVPSLDLPETGSYTQTTICLPAAAVGRRATLEFSMKDSDGSSGCVTAIAIETAFYDDVEVTTDASCPAT